LDFNVAPHCYCCYTDCINAILNKTSVYIQIKAFARNKYIAYFKSKSSNYQQLINTLQNDSTVQYILNRRVLKDDFEGNFSMIDDKVFKSLQVIDSVALQQQYGIMDKRYGVVIQSAVPDDL